MLRLAVCDDNSEVIEQMESYIDRMGKRRIEYDVFHSGEELYRYHLQGNNYDMYLLDIEMKSMSGLKLAKLLREDLSQALIVFLTGYSQYVYDVFEVVTFDFIIKPIVFEKFEQLIEKAERYLKITCANFIFHYRKNTYSVPCNTISYIEKVGRKAYVHESDGTVHQSNMTLDEIWNQLDRRVFVAIHISYIVNLAEIIGIEHDVIKLKNEKTLYVSRNYRQKVKQQHLQYLMGLL